MTNDLEKRIEELEESVGELAKKMAEFFVLNENVIKITTRNLERLSDRLWLLEKEKGLIDGN